MWPCWGQKYSSRAGTRLWQYAFSISLIKIQIQTIVGVTGRWDTGNATDGCVMCGRHRLTRIRDCPAAAAWTERLVQPRKHIPPRLTTRVRLGELVVAPGWDAGTPRKYRSNA